MTTFRHQFGEGQVSPFDQWASGVMNLMSLFAQVILDCLRSAVSRQQQGPSFHLFWSGSSRGTRSVHVRKNVRIVNEVAENRQGALASQP